MPLKSHIPSRRQRDLAPVPAKPTNVLSGHDRPCGRARSAQPRNFESLPTMKILLAASAVLFATPALAAPSLAGHWAIHNIVAGNENDATCDFATADNKISGTCNAQGK